MKRLILACLITSTALMGNPFFAFDNGLGGKSPSEQAALLKQVGYDGIGYKGPIGLQCFQVPGAPEDHLKRSFAKWREIRGMVVEPSKP